MTWLDESAPFTLDQYARLKTWASHPLPFVPDCRHDGATMTTLSRYGSAIRSFRRCLRCGLEIATPGQQNAPAGDPPGRSDAVTG